MRRIAALATVLAVGSLALSGPAPATMLEKRICDDLKVEHGLLQSKGLPSDMTRGAAWAKANLPQERLREIERLIHVEEQLAFRCPQPKRVPPPDEDDDPTVAKTAKTPVPKAKQKTPAAGTAAAAPGQAQQQPAPPKKAARPAAAPTESGSEPVKAPPRKVAAPKPKAKADDAYSPPGPSPTSPFKN